MSKYDPIGNRAEVLSHLVEWVDLKNDIFIITSPATDEHPPISYTIGMEKNFDSPEIIIYGLPTQSSRIMLNAIKDKLKDGWKIEYNKRIPGIAHDYDTIFIDFPPDKVKEIFKMTLWYYRDTPFRTAQAVWPDENNIFPWEGGYDEGFRNYQHNI